MATAVHVGDLVEVLADDTDETYWYGQVMSTTPKLSVNYISHHKGDVWRFDEQAFYVDIECVNHVVRASETPCKVDAWQQLGWVYRGDHEIIHGGDVNTESEDGDWVPGPDDKTSDESECSDDDEDASSSSVDEP